MAVWAKITSFCGFLLFFSGVFFFSFFWADVPLEFQVSQVFWMLAAVGIISQMLRQSCKMFGHGKEPEFPVAGV